MPRQNSRKGRFVFKGRSSSVDFLPMTLRTRFLITALFLCHQVLAAALVTRQLLSENSEQAADSSSPKAEQKAETQTAASSTPCARQAANQDSDSATICADQQEKDGDVYKLHGNAEIHYRNYVLKADEVTYDSNSGGSTAVRTTTTSKRVMEPTI
jgi:lipopolysaccharide assembly outer membrane protein LptD (OstA)